MFTVWLITLVALTLAAVVIGFAIRSDRGVQAPPRSHFRDPQFRSPMSA